MSNNFPGGVWPVMLTPYTKDNQVDYQALAELIEWYKREGVSGFFAVCQSSEMFFLSLEERVAVARFVKEHAGDLPVVASGHVSDAFEDQVEEITGILILFRATAEIEIHCFQCCQELAAEHPG